MGKTAKKKKTLFQQKKHHICIVTQGILGMSFYGYLL